MEVALRTDVGRVRDLNEDTIGCFHARCGTLVAVIADGMGGHQAGEVASRNTVETIEQELSLLNLKLTNEEKGNRLLYAVGKANERVYQMGMSNQHLQGMGTTVVAVVADQAEVVFTL